MTRLIATLSLVGTIVALAGAQPAFAAKKKAAAKPACTAGALCTGPCNTAKWCNVQVCATSGKMTPTLSVCFEGSPFCPPKC
ncbi:MAG TPA: hypothetical protein VJL90_07470 [Pseudorhodoplanes sp.]|nr:hypothetical protein [Pseudorhodoplanes sp.]